MSKKLISVVLIVCMMFTVMSCGQSSNSSIGYGEEQWQIDRDEEPVTITYLTIGDKPTNGMTEEVVKKLNKILLKKVNAKLDIFYVGWNDYLDTYNRVIDSEDLDIDLIATSADWLDAWPNVIEGNFLPMTQEMLATFCPMTYANVKESQWKQCSYEGQIYFIPENEYSQWTNHGFVYRGDIANEAGVTDIKNWEDVTRYLEYVVDNKPDMIPWDADGTTNILGLGYLMSTSKYNPIYEISTYGIWGAYSDKPGVVISPYYEGQELIEFAKTMKHWNNIGVWREDLSDAGDNSDEFIDGTTSLDQQHTQMYFTDVRPQMEINQPISDTRFYWFGKESGNLMKDSILHGAMAISSRSKNPEKALMVYDLLRNNEECYRLIRYGIEGRQYVLTEGDKIEKPSGYNDQRDAFLTNFWWGRRDEFEKIDSSYAWDKYYELLEQYDYVAIDYPWDGYNFSSVLSDKRTKAVIEVFNKYIPELSYGQYDVTPEEEVALFREELKSAGFEEVTENIQRTIDEY